MLVYKQRKKLGSRPNRKSKPKSNRKIDSISRLKWQMSMVYLELKESQDRWIKINAIIQNCKVLRCKILNSSMTSYIRQRSLRDLSCWGATPILLGWQVLGPPLIQHIDKGLSRELKRVLKVQTKRCLSSRWRSYNQNLFLNLHCP